MRKQFISDKTQTIKTELETEIEQKKQVQLNTIDPKKKRPATPPLTAVNFMDETIAV